MMTKILISVAIGLGAVLQTSFYVTPRNRICSSISLGLVTGLAFAYLSVDSPAERIYVACIASAAALAAGNFFYKEKFFCKFYNGLMQAIVSSCILYIAGWVFQNSQLLLLILLVFLNMLWCIVMYAMRKRKYTIMPYSEETYRLAAGICLIAYIILQRFILGISVIHRFSSQAILPVLIVIITLLVVTYVLNLFIFSNMKLMEEFQIRAIAKNNTLLKQYIDEHISHYDKIRIMEHDQRHWVSTVIGLLEMNDQQRALGLLKEIYYRSMASSSKIYCDNHLINAILLDASRRCADAFVPFTVTVQVAEEIQIEDIDLTSLLMNILTNAIDNCAPWKDGMETYVKISVFTSGGYLVIKCINSVKAIPVIVKNKITSTKCDDGMLHGIGLESIDMIVQKYDGKLELQADNGVFAIHVVLKNDAADEAS